MRKCDSCGKAYSENKDVFCPHCGAVASKKCTHTSSYDSSRYDRGELYETENKYSPYKQGTEPHAQRTPYSQNTDTSPINPQTILTQVLEKTKKGDSDEIKKIKSIVSVIVFIIGLIVFVTNFAAESGIFDESYYDNGYAYEDDYNYTFAQTDSAELNATVDTDNLFSFDLEIGSLYFSQLDNSFVNDYSEEILSEGYYSQLEILVVNSESTDFYEYDEDYYSLYIVSDEAGSNGVYSFADTPQETGVIIYIQSYVLNTDYGDIEVELPFDAFSCDREGNITYYQNVSETEEEISLEECEPTLDFPEDEFEAVISFEDGEVSFYDNGNEYEFVTEVVLWDEE